MKPLHVIPLRQSEHGSCVAKKMQSLVRGRVLAGLAKNVWMQLISPWRRGDADSLLVATVTGSRADLDRIAAPNSLLPDDTCLRVSGMIADSVMLSKVDTSFSGE